MPKCLPRIVYVNSTWGLLKKSFTIMHLCLIASKGIAYYGNMPSLGIRHVINRVQTHNTVTGGISNICMLHMRTEVTRCLLKHLR